MELSAPQISALNRIYPERTKALVTNAITDLVLFFNVGKTMSQEQCVEVVELLIKNYSFLRPAELKYCFDKIKMSHYGTVYNRMDGAVVFECIEKFLTERMENIEIINRQKKSDSDAIATMVLTELQEKLKFKIEHKKIDEPKPREKTKEEKLVQQWMNDFDKLYREKPSNGSIRFVSFNNKMLNIDGYLNARLGEYNQQKI